MCIFAAVMKRLLALIFVIMNTFAAGAVIRINVSGRVLLQDSDELKGGDYVMIYARDLGTGTLSDEQGNYSLSLPSRIPAKVRIEYSRIGYETITRTLDLQTYEVAAEDVILQPQYLMLTAAYVTPDGKDPAEVVLDKVWEHSRSVRKNPFDYRCQINYTVSTHELPLVSEAIPRGYVGLAKFVGATQGYGPLVRYCLKNDDFTAKASINRQVKDGQKLDYNKKLLESDQPLPDNVRQNVLSLCDIIDVFEIMYGDISSNWGDHWTSKHKFKIIGTYEYDGNLVDVLSHTDRRNRSTINIHIVEEKWMMLKIQFYTREGEVCRVEARDIGNGVYMPVSLLLKPSVSMIRAEQIPGLIEAIRRDKNIKKGPKERMIKVLEDHLGEDFNPYISVASSLRYF